MLMTPCIEATALGACRATIGLHTDCTVMTKPMHTAVWMNKLPNIPAVWPVFIAEGPNTPPLSTSFELAAAATATKPVPQLGMVGPLFCTDQMGRQPTGFVDCICLTLPYKSLLSCYYDSPPETLARPQCRKPIWALSDNHAPIRAA
jgi:hypothetical protein